MNLSEYKKIPLPELQSIYLVRLGEVINFLEKNNIEYFAIGGTALGAFRHHGFIPWDNDVDLGMTRENFERFIRIAPQLENSHFAILNYRFSNPVEHGLIKLGLKGTFCPERGLKKNYDTYYHIDIFPYDSVPNDSELANKQAKQTKRIKQLLYFKSRKKSSSSFKNLFLFLYQLLLIPFSTKKLARKLDEIGQKYNKTEPCSEYVTNVMGAYSYEKEMVSRDCINGTSVMGFSGIELKVPANCAKFLEEVYGPHFMTPADIRLDKDVYFAYVKNDFVI